MNDSDKAAVQFVKDFFDVLYDMGYYLDGDGYEADGTVLMTRDRGLVEYFDSLRNGK